MENVAHQNPHVQLYHGWAWGPPLSGQGKEQWSWKVTNISFMGCEMKMKEENMPFGKTFQTSHFQGSLLLTDAHN